MKKEIPIFDSTDKYMHWLIPNFISIAKGARLTPKWLAIMIIRDGITSPEKDFLTEILFNHEVVLAWDFIEMKKVKKKVAPI